MMNVTSLRRMMMALMDEVAIFSGWMGSSNDPVISTTFKARIDQWLGVDLDDLTQAKADIGTPEASPAQE
jgi:hypothetical protein